MWRPTSEPQDRVIENDDLQEEIMMMAQEPFVTAEVEYRTARAKAQFSHPKGRRHWVPRRPSLHLPPSRRRPLSVA